MGEEIANGDGGREAETKETDRGDDNGDKMGCLSKPH